MRRARTFGFTVVELLIAVAVLVVIILATARIFGTASAVTSYGEANANIQQTAAAVERVIRQDVARMSPEGFLVIQCIAVRNDINQTTRWPQAQNFGGSAIAPLLDPTRPAEAIIRCDRVIFFTDGFDQTARFVGSFNMGTQGGNQQALASRIYIGPGVQFPTLRRLNNGLLPDPGLFDFNTAVMPAVPWAFDGPPQPNLTVSPWAVANGSAPNVFGTQPPARQWVLARQATLLADDGGAKRWFNSDNEFGPNSATAIWSRAFPAPHFGAAADDTIAYQGFTATDSLFPDSWIASGRVDIAASTLDDIRRTATKGANGATLPWLQGANSQWQRIRNMSVGPPVSAGAGATLAGIWGWPRSEKSPPSPGRMEEILTATMLSGNCSSIEIDWAWREGTGRVERTTGFLETAAYAFSGSSASTVGLPGVAFDPAAGQVWFGLPDGLQNNVALPEGGTFVIPQSQWRGVTSLMGPQPAWDAVATSVPNAATYIGTNIFNHGTNQWQQFNGSLFPSGGGAAAVIGPPVRPGNIEGPFGITRPLGVNMPVWVYTAVFGFNHNQPVSETFNGLKVLRDDYTPWPSALRFTLRLHDPRLTVEAGRTVQFVVDLPRQTQE
ncbi:MAG: hypothetical protein KF724_05280 [Phycisphaeraceae bacterium]|nr:hypothetical protein [Phycisphaeraceae bacterium]